MLNTTKTLSPRRSGLAVIASLATLGTIAALAGCAPAGGDSDTVTITLSGPNQFTSDTKTFGPAWDDLISNFEKDNPDIEVKTNVLPLSSWSQTSAAQLTAGTAPELIFNQTTHSPDQVVSLDEALAEPNEFSDTGKPWIEDFNSKYFGGDDRLGQNTAGHYESIPFNLVSVGIYFNKDILDDAGVDVEDLATFDGFLDACREIKDAGHIPLATDNGNLPVGWASTALSSMLLVPETEAVNQFGADGEAGTSSPVTVKSVAHGYLTDEINMSKDPGFAAVLESLKKLYDECATPNWSGINSEGAFTGGTDFPGNKAAMAWGTNFASTQLDTVDFEYGTIPFPTLAKSDSDQATGEPAQFGVNNGGTAYMIPAYIKGKQLDAAITFLQYVSSPKVQTWLDETGGIPAVSALTAPPGLEAMNAGAWATLSLGGQNGGLWRGPKAVAAENTRTGYLLGTTSLEDELIKLNDNAVAWAKEQAVEAKWTEEWAQ
ncbi:ABC transporter substrate-binding protein [Microbacterium murale]|uniref:ABC-type glycerol-3-phosphate transport system substrate-binding protein n=1 Tax=Microbacterium murale TaxID=1081040 RepID=A0ABU0P5Q3_9MICO|nr:extracellular solute-binding protein [Microbacterium murale]MDQ0642648.1 ABC-type glycerol-3-phosphate transport system substrate-binding protein [Microbacterium murale]